MNDLQSNGGMLYLIPIFRATGLCVYLEDLKIDMDTK